MSKLQIREIENKELIDELYSRKISSKEDLISMINQVEEYYPDYGASCHVVAALMLAAGRYSSYRYDVTNFMAGCVIWEVIERFGVFGKGKKAIINWANMLYPQYDYTMPRSIDRKTFEWVVALSKKEDLTRGTDAVINRIKCLQQGNVPEGFYIRKEA